MSRITRLLGVALLTLTPLCEALSQEPETPPSRGRGEPIPSSSNHSDRYRKSWALIIGINYSDRQSTLTDPADRLALPALGNAEDDANKLAEALSKYYGYTTEGPDATLDILIGQEATTEAIHRSLARLIDDQNVQEDDSVLLFFAGHGVRIENDPGERAAIYPYDVQLSNGKPINNYIRLHKDLFSKLRSSKARHKLAILDSCYSGAIFDIDFRARSETDDRGDEVLFHQPGFQAMASCRAFQVASDGSGVNSPFTKELLKGLEQLPARDYEPKPIWTNKLFAFIYPWLKNLPDGQKPDCRNLEGEGEFRFFPAPGVDFSKFRGDSSDHKLLQATITSEQGNWWFEEMPWFIPSLRGQILSQIPDSRGGAELIRRDVLRAYAREIAEQGDKAQPGGSMPADLRSLRGRHASKLLKTEFGEQFDRVVEEIAADLLNPNYAQQLEAEDLHLLAVVQHAMGKSDEAYESYKAAIEKYKGHKTTDETGATAKKALLALCKSDMGHFLLEIRAEPAEAAVAFREANKLFGNLAPPAFQIFVLCREADAWLNQNRWAEADDRLEMALHVATDFDPNHSLTAYVHHRRAWAQIIQWQISEAERSFIKANKILHGLLAQQQGLGDAATPTHNSPDAPATDDPTATTADEFVIDDVIRVSTNFQAKITYFHNLHGLAMAKRFKGEVESAAMKYRMIVAAIEDAIDRLQRSSGYISGDVETALYTRLVNSSERLGDCNLFGDSRRSDLKEALDDYRRALSWTHRIPATQRDRQRAGLLYKQALTLTLPPCTQTSDIRDLDLALRICDEADKVYKPLSDTANGLLLALGELTTPIVKVAHAKELRQPSTEQTYQEAVETLRAAIVEFRDANGPTLHRDQLELCLVASKVLLEQGCEKDRFHRNQDTALLLSFCRLALSAYRGDQATPANQEGIPTSSQPGGETRAYLRPYYDTAMRSKLQAQTKHVKDLLEIQWEATQGSRYVKDEEAKPILALYCLDGDCYLLVDLPRGTSKSYPLTNQYDLAEIQAACIDPNKNLELPREIHQQLTQWRENEAGGRTDVRASLWWPDPIRGFGGAATTLTGTDGVERHTVLKPLERSSPQSSFPFQLPPGFLNTVPDAPIAPSSPAAN